MMFITSLAAVLLTTAASATLHDVLAGRQVNSAEEKYLNEVCFPNTTNPVVPPCQEVINIQSACQPNGTTSLDLQAHAQCMCGGSYFSDWLGCLNCDFVHGARSPQIVSSYNAIITSASQALCTGTPTAPFASIFASLDSGSKASSGGASLTDLYPSKTDISLYYTPTKSQGVGAITGAATAATKTGSGGATTGTGATGSQTTLNGGKSSGAGSAGGSGTAAGASSTSSSKAGAAPTGVWMGALGFVAGGAAMLVV
ncbi:hypothetical protein BGZ60DRAFT_423010 [Tricladium varicosporioides]|nr:hypothetical protein BGZ60DRAFT_423010 [Hymenoscyphus varicosporioides]